jgi:pimeloyl-ACP methyl ester carboxylesterase
MKFLGRFMARTEDRDAPTTLALRDAQYDAIVEWGIPDHGALQRLTAIRCRTLIIQGDGDLMIPTSLSHLMAGLIPTLRSASTRTPRTPSSSRSRSRSPPTSTRSWHNRPRE